MAAMQLNVIVLTSDEMRGDCPGFMGNPDCRTPSLDTFAKNGVVFANHFAVHGKCVPSRIALSTGRYSHTDGFRTITQHLPPGQPDLLSKLKALGYETAVFGHNHVWENFFASNKKGGGCTDYHSYTEEYFDHLLKRQWPVESGKDSRWQPLDLPERMLEYKGRRTAPLTGFCDDNRAEQAIQYLTRVRDRSQPFYLHVNLSAPHPTYQVEEPFYSMYDRQALRAWPHELPKNAPLPARKMREIRTGQYATAEVLREIQAVYYGMITKVDLLLGRILEAIEREGLFENSIVLFTTDHGDFAGQYGLIEKWDTCLADCILHVPHVLRAPGLPQGVRVEGLTEHTDVAPTILELLHVAPDWGIHGQSLLPAIRGEKRKPAVFADGGHEAEMWPRHNLARDNPTSKQKTYMLAPETMARAKMVRTEDWKLVVRLVGGNELYDLRNDPHELDNLWGRPELMPVLLDLQQQLIDWCLRTDTDRPHQKDVGA